MSAFFPSSAIRIIFDFLLLWQSTFLTSAPTLFSPRRNFVPLGPGTLKILFQAGVLDVANDNHLALQLPPNVLLSFFPC